ncbi:hypothetical protein DIPPA_15778 [Diplonema papillatum]|nr:hypothetical protein DIPPA_15778 [Diplonema papillatum]
MEVACESPAAAVEQSVEKVREKMSRTAYDLEVSLLMGALRSMRKTAVLNPFPKAFVEGVERRYDLLQMAAQTLPPADQLYEGDASELNASLSPNARQLLSFLVNNSNLKEVPVGPAIKGLISEKDNPSLVPQKVFEVSLGPRAKEFDEAALQYGVRVGYHGSAVGNWFCISKMGLFNFSGTQKQATGSLFGEGIYLAKTPRLACDFSSRGECWKESEHGSSLRVVGVCDWLPTPGTMKASSETKTDGGKVPEAYIVVPNASHVRVRKLLVYTSHVTPKTAEAVRWRFTPMHMIAVYIVVLLAIVMSQTENRVYFRYLWKQGRKQLARLV